MTAADERVAEIQHRLVDQEYAAASGDIAYLLEALADRDHRISTLRRRVLYGDAA